MPHKDPGKARAYERERHRKRTAERLVRGLCPKCGKTPPAPGRSVCAPCGERGRKSERARYARGKAEGKRYGGRKPESRRRAAWERNRKRRRERREAGLCTRCGDHPPLEGSVACEPCREVRRAAERELYAARRAKGLCGRCGGEVLPKGDFADASLCGPCAALCDGYDREKKNTARRGRYARLRARGLCTDCGEPAQGTARCESCAYRSYARSGQHRGLPLYPPRYTVVELATGEDLGTWDSWEEVAMCLAFAKLSREEVEVITDASPMMTITAWG